MAFGIGTNCEKSDAGEITGLQKEIACECWFTVTGRSIPLMFRVQDEDGVIQTVRNIRVLHSEKKNFAGVPTVEYTCEIMLARKQRQVRLIYMVMENRWVLCW